MNGERLEIKTSANTIFAPGGVDVWLKVLLSLFRFVLGTGRSSKLPARSQIFTLAASAKVHVR